ncbi:HAD family hydrolase [Paraburkholderia megapolitana]|uniref:HAD family hydrolase n=1 Tax=Paraburkholderia megapolitana TaxID=420953 RepID=UPI0038BC7FBE
MLDSSPAQSILKAPVKLVIWDLDETFWKGTLSEEGMTPIPDNIDMVKRLARRGIISSVCSKNEPDAALAALRNLDVLDYFILPSVSFQPKGQSISNIISALQLRPDDVVFIDDNPSVLAQAGHSCPGMVCLDSPRQLAALMDSPFLQGAHDSELTRLHQYRLLAEKHDLKQAAGGNDESFLRQSDIRVEIDFAVEENIERVVELINRSNQLNYTKRRIETAEERQRLLDDLHAFGFNGGIVRVRDRYGDYGIVGFFMTLATLREYRLEHFVFSCRIMNMGIEQYVYEYLKRPEIDIVGPVANAVVTYASVDWIKDASAGDVISMLRQYKLVVIGGCDMLQLSTYCSADSSEFTNRQQNGLMKRLDDPFLVLDDPERVRKSVLRPHIPAFNADEMLALKAAVEQADLIVLSIYRMMEINYFRGVDGMAVRFDEDAVRDMLKSELALWFVRNFTFISSTNEERQEIIRHVLHKLSSWAKAGARIVVLLENTRKLENNPDELGHRQRYNEFIVDTCGTLDKLTYVDVNAVTRIDWLFDDGFHMRREGYYELAQAVTRVFDDSSEEGQPVVARAVAV